MTRNFWQQQAEDELQRAELARQNGNEGQARVSARRAAGTIVREYLRQQGFEASQMSAYETLLFALSLPHLPASARPILEHLVLRVEPGGKMPIPVDLVAETRQLAFQLKMVPNQADLRQARGS